MTEQTWSEDDLRAFNAAKDTLNALIGEYSARLAASTDRNEIVRLRDERARAVRARRILPVDDRDAIDATKQQAAAQLAALRGEAST